MVDRIIFVCILLLAGVYFWATAQIPSLEIGDPLGPKAFPRLLGVGLLITAAMLLGEMIRERKAAKAGEPVASAEAEDDGNPRVVAITVVATAIYFLLFEPLGYVITTAAYLLVMTHIFYKKGRCLVNTLTSVVYGLGSYLAFTKLLGVNLPAGILPF
jgi:putative tricarboxylic transport membrane protein